jgi:hypothetical protein
MDYLCKLPKLLAGLKHLGIKYTAVRFEVFMAVTMKVSSGMLRRVALVGTDVLQELSASFIRVTRISELGTTLAVTSNRRTLRWYFFAMCVGC